MCAQPKAFPRSFMVSECTQETGRASPENLTGFLPRTLTLVLKCMTLRSPFLAPLFTWLLVYTKCL